MNPTINKSEELGFESRFEGGNLDCVVKVNDNEYDIFLRIDSNTRGNIFWYYFAINNCKKGRKVRFNLCNLTKSDTHYKKVITCLSKSGSKSLYAYLFYKYLDSRRNDKRHLPTKTT